MNHLSWPTEIRESNLEGVEKSDFETEDEDEAQDNGEDYDF